MPKYRVKYVYERWYNLDLEAENEAQARKKFETAEFEEEPTITGGELQSRYEIEELQEASK